jgi:hypothetical protein
MAEIITNLTCNWRYAAAMGRRAAIRHNQSTQFVKLIQN